VFGTDFVVKPPPKLMLFSRNAELKDSSLIAPKLRVFVDDLVQH
jgi:hypothetical protein